MMTTHAIGLFFEGEPLRSLSLIALSFLNWSSHNRWHYAPPSDLRLVTSHSVSPYDCGPTEPHFVAMLHCNKTLAKGKGIDEKYCGRREVERQYGINIFLGTFELPFQSLHHIILLITSLNCRYWS